MSKQSNASSGIGFTGLLTILFIALKLTGVIAWSWWWVLSPLWIHLAIVLAVVLGVFAFVFSTHKLSTSARTATRSRK